MAVRQNIDPRRAATQAAKAVGAATLTAAATTGVPHSLPGYNMSATIRQVPSAGGAGMAKPVERETVADMIAVSEAKTDTKFAELRGDLKALDEKISALPGTWTMAGIGLAIVAAVLGALALGSQMFGQGFSAADIAKRAAEQALAAQAVSMKAAVVPAARH